MKNRRSTIIVAIMVTLLGTPRVWQELGNILSSLQHKTQNKLLNMVVSSQVREGGEEEVAGTLMTEERAACSASNPSQIAEGRNSVNLSASRKVKAQRHASHGSDWSPSLALRSEKKDGVRESMPPAEESLAWVGENQLSMHTLASLPQESMIDNNNVTEFVTLPRVNAVAPAFAVRGVELFKLKKAFEESKGFRQKVRYVISKGTPSLPPA